ILFRGWDRASSESGPVIWLRRTMIAVLGVIHVVLAPLATLGTWALVQEAARASERVARQMKDAAGGARRVVLLTGSDPAVWIYALRLARDEHSGLSRDGCWWVASAARADHRIEPIDARAFSLETIGTTFLNDDTERMYRAMRLPIAAGE